MIKRIFVILGLVLLVSYLAVAGIVYRIGNESMSCKDVTIHIKDVDDVGIVSERDIQQQIATVRKKIIGQRFDSINTLDISQMIESNQLVRKASCYHTPDSCLRIDIEQRKPILRIQSSTIGNHYVDQDRMLLPVQAVVPIQIPLATGYISKEIAENDLYDIADFLSDNRFWREEITQIYVNTNGDIELVPRVGQHTILVGDAKNLEKKLDNVKKFYAKVLSRKGWNYYKVVNVKFENQVIGEK